MQKLIDYAEKYSQWVALAIGALWFVWMVYGSFLSPPVTVSIGAAEVGPGDVDKKIVEGPIARLKNDMASTNSPKMPVEPFAQKFADAMGLKGMESYALAEPFMAAPTTDVRDSRIVINPKDLPIGEIPIVPPAQPLAITAGRSTVQVPPPDWKPEANNPQAQPAFLVDDRDWVSVFFTVDLQALAQAFADAHLAVPQGQPGFKTAFLEVTLIRQELQPNGAWGAEQIVKTLPIHQIEPFPQKGNRVQEAKFNEFAIRKSADIVNPSFYQVLFGKPWFKPGEDPAANQPEVQPEMVIPKQDQQPKLPKQPKEPAKPRPSKRDDGPPNPTRKGGGPGGGGGRPGYVLNDPQRPASAFDRGYQNAPMPPPMINPTGPGSPANFGGGAPQMPAAAARPQGDQPALNQAVPAGNFEPAQFGVVTIWAHDDNAQPNKTYRYRLEYKIRNPLFGTARVAKNQNDALVFAIQAELTKKIIDAQWTAPISIPPRTVFFVFGTNPGGDFPTTKVDVFNWHRGEWHHKQTNYAPGDLIRWSGRGEDGQVIDFSSGWTVVDLRIDPKNQDAYVLLIGDDGNMIKRYSRTDQNDDEFKKLKEQTEKVKAAAANAIGPR